jgi:hypothetical protein
MEYLSSRSLKQLLQIAKSRITGFEKGVGTERVQDEFPGGKDAREALQEALHTMDLAWELAPSKGTSGPKPFAYAAKEALTPCKKGTKQAALVDLLRKGGATREELQPAIGVRDAHYVLHMLAPHGYGLRADFEGGVERLVLVLPEGAQVPPHAERAGKKGPLVDPAQVDWEKDPVPETAA